VAAIFHMVTHAFFKALMFLGSGSVIHGMHEQQDMKRMGALRKAMPITAYTFLVGWLAIAGVFPLAGFWSKDEILLFAYDKSPVLWALGLVTALLTAFYMSRQVFMVFFGEERFAKEGDHAVHPHESPWTMTLPLVVLAGLSLVGGALSFPFADKASWLPSLESWLEPVLEGNEHVVDMSGAQKAGFAIGTMLLAIFAILVARWIYLLKAREPVEPELFAHGWYYDESITRFAGGPGREAFEGAATFDAKVVDGAVNGVASLVRLGASKLRLAQTGYVRNYALGITIGAVVMIGLFLGRAV
jgi:NADH-quinone oxidoreductase subunit L